MIIGICGYKGSGKSTVTNAAIHQPGMRGFVRMGFSDPLYDMLLAMGIPDYIVGDKAKWDLPLDILCGKSTRHACDTLGTSWGQEHIDREVWSKIAIRRAKKCQGVGQCVILDNVRFRHEADAVLAERGTLIAFERNGLVPDLTKQAEQQVAYIQRNLCTVTFMNAGKNLHTDARKFAEILKWIRAGN